VTTVKTTLLMILSVCHVLAASDGDILFQVQQLPAGSSLDAIINHSMKNRSKCGELQRWLCLMSNGVFHGANMLYADTTCNH